MFHILIRLALLLAMLNNEGMGGLEIHDDSPEVDPVSPVVLGSFLKYGLTEISTLTLTHLLTLIRWGVRAHHMPASLPLNEPDSG